MSKRQRMDYDSQATLGYGYSQQTSRGSRSRAKFGRLRSRTRKSVQNYPRYRTVTPYNTPFTIERNVEMDVYLNLANGFNNRGAGVALIWSLASMVTTFADGFTIATAMPGAAELAAVFDQWRIDRVDTSIFFSATNHQIVSSATNTISQPIINIVSDFDNNNANENLLEYPQCRTHQLGAVRPIVHTIFKPGAITQQEIIGAGLQAPARVTRSPWLDCAVTDVPHYCAKISYAQFNPTAIDYNPDITVGAVKFRCKVYYTLKNPR